MSINTSFLIMSAIPRAFTAVIAFVSFVGHWQMKLLLSVTSAFMEFAQVSMGFGALHV